MKREFRLLFPWGILTHSSLSHAIAHKEVGPRLSTGRRNSGKGCQRKVAETLRCHSAAACFLRSTAIK